MQPVRPARNNFHLLRFVCALVVCIYHSYELSHFPELSWVLKYLPQNAALNCFFIISGYLISLSHDRSKTEFVFLKKRFLRVYPAYFCIVIVFSLLLFVYSAQDAGAYFGLDWVKYLTANLLFLNFVQPNLPGVFEGNLLREVNGSLWTIKVEAFLYATVPVCGFLSRRFSRNFTLPVLYIVTAAAHVILQRTAQTNSLSYHLAREVSGPLSYFCAGALMYRFNSALERSRTHLALGGCCILALGQLYELTWLTPLAMASVVIFLALGFYLGRFERYGDFSYGIYILHFPIIQILLTYHWAHAYPLGYLAAVLSITLSGAVVVWHLIEKRFISHAT
jgi:peptidoglycan/LPS O-acetylase OafA/YrhL